MDFIKMIMELPGDKRSQDVVEHTEWNNLWKLIVTQGNHSENYLEQLYNYFFNKERGWVYKIQAELNGVQPYVEGVMTQPVGKAPDGSLWTYPSTESGTVPWGNVMGDITKQQDLIQKFEAKSDVGHKHFGMDLILKNGDIPGFVIEDGSIPEAAYGSKSIPTSALKDSSVTTEKLNNAAVTSAKIASGAVINDSIANGAVSGVKIASETITRAKLANDALYSPLEQKGSNYTLTLDDIGKTILSDSSSPSDVRVITLNATNNDAMPIGTEFAIMAGNTGTTKLTVEAGIGIRGNKDGDIISSDGITVTIPRYGMIALKKFYAKHWLITGVFEVVA